MKESEKYKVEAELKHDEALAKINLSTGEVTTINPIVKHVQTVKNLKLEDFRHESIFQKTYIKAWNLLRTQTTDKEFKIATLMALRAKPFTNSLDPLNDDVTSEYLASEFQTDRNSVKKVLEKLFKLGVYGKFELYATYTNFKKYWIFNPYLSFNGSKIDKSILGLFEETVYKSVIDN